MLSGMLCGIPNQDDVVALSGCLMNTWDIHYTFYYWLHYILGGLGVLLPILATVLSDLDNKGLRRLITGASAVSVALYAFLSPSDNMVAYKSAHAELRQLLVIYEETNKLMGQPKGDISTKVMLLGGIGEIERQILNSEKGASKKEQNGQKSGGGTPGAATAAAPSPSPSPAVSAP